MKFPLATAWLAANERQDLKAKVHIARWAQDLAAGMRHPSFAGWLVREWSKHYVSLS